MKFLKLALAGAVSALCATAAQAEIVLSFTPAAQSIAVGGTASIDVSISGLGSEILSGFDLNFLWNSSILGQGTVDFTPACGALGPAASCTQDPTSPGNIGLFYFAVADDADLELGQANDFVLGTLTFTGLADGSTILGLGADLDFERNFTGLGAESLSVTVGSACIAVGTGSCSTVPEPESYGLVGLALFAAGAVSRRVRKPAITA